MLELREDTLIFQFPEVHEYAECKIDFQRTLRIPDDNRAYELPPGLGRFPIEHVEDHSSRLPEAWAKQGCVLLPMYQAEALWLNFSGYYPCAIKIAAGKINAVTGGDWSNDLNQAPQDYIVVPGQEWLDGFCVQKGLIRQFVAMPLGQGYTAEEQITGTAEFGGIQIIVYPMKREIFERRERARAAELRFSIAAPCFCEDASMGLAPGGLMHQEIYEDDYGFEQWDTSTSSRCFVHILNSKQWEHVTGKALPGKPPSVGDYTAAGLPWFAYYNDRLCALEGAKKLAELDSVAAKGVKLGETPLPKNEAVNPQHIIQLGTQQVKDGKW